MSRSHPLGTICQDGRIVSDPLHPVVLEGGELHPIVNFDFAAIDGPESELSVSLTEMASGLSEILFWLSSSRDPALVAGRVHSLYTWLNPIDEPYKSLSEISRVYNVPRATLSKALVILRDAVGCTISGGKLERSRKALRKLYRSQIAQTSRQWQVLSHSA